jgi:DNA-binding HxlR family transcriptional regulator
MADHGFQWTDLDRPLDVAWEILGELAEGPQRLTDLIECLPSVSRKLLTERLDELERDGVIARRKLPPPAAREIYELTEDGRALARAIGPASGWGA